MFDLLLSRGVQHMTCSGFCDHNEDYGSDMDFRHHLIDIDDHYTDEEVAGAVCSMKLSAVGQLGKARRWAINGWIQDLKCPLRINRDANKLAVGSGTARQHCGAVGNYISIATLQVFRSSSPIED